MKLAKLLLLMIVMGAALAAWVFYLPFGPHTETFVDIPSGTGTQGMASRLAGARIIRSRYGFEALRLFRGGRLKAGEYRFDHPATLGEIYARIARGDVYTRAVVIPEGFNIFDIAQAVEVAGLGTKADFLSAERRNAPLIADLNPHAVSLEGFLFPDTYRFSRHTTHDQMVAAMVHRFRQVALPLGLAPDVAKNVVLASLIEKEVHVDEERPLVAGVFENRLAKSMPLATDPAVVYAALLADRWRGTIYQSDLQFESPYNTYRHAGLPPGPICNPGLAALKAALAPAHTDFLYFVADANGHSRFSAGLEEHNQQVDAYRQSVRAPDAHR